MLCSFMYALLMFTLTALTIFIAHLENFFYTLSLPLLAVSTGMAHMILYSEQFPKKTYKQIGELVKYKSNMIQHCGLNNVNNNLYI